MVPEFALFIGINTQNCGRRSGEGNEEKEEDSLFLDAENSPICGRLVTEEGVGERAAYEAVERSESLIDECSKHEGGDGNRVRGRGSFGRPVWGRGGACPFLLFCSELFGMRSNGSVGWGFGLTPQQLGSEPAMGERRCAGGRGKGRQRLSSPLVLSGTFGQYKHQHARVGCASL